MQFGFVVQQVDAQTYYLDGSYEVGDSLEFWDQDTLAPLGTGTVVSAVEVYNGPSVVIDPTHDAVGEFLVTFDQPISLPAVTLVVMDGKRLNENFVVRNSWFHDDFQRTMINGSPRGLFEGNTIQNTGHGLCIFYEITELWIEGPFASDLVVRNNRFLNAPPATTSVNTWGAAILVWGSLDSGRPVQNLTISGNYFSESVEKPIEINRVDGLQIDGNTIARTSTSSPSWTDWLDLKNCINVTIGANHFDMLWDNGSGDQLWSSSSLNWDGDFAWADGFSSRFADAGAGNVTLSGAAVSAEFVVFSNTAGNDYSIASAAGKTLTASGGISLTGSGNVTIDSVIADATSVAHAGTGTLVLNATNTFTGGVTLASGASLDTSGTQALGDLSQATALTIENGGSLLVGEGDSFADYGVGSIQLSGAGVGGAGAIDFSGGNNYAPFDGQWDLLDDVTIDIAGGRMDYDGVISTTGAANVTLTKNGAGTLQANWDLSSASIAELVIAGGALYFEGSPDNGSTLIRMQAGTQLARWAPGSRTTNGDVVLEGATLTTSGADSAFVYTWSGDFELTADSTLTTSQPSHSLAFSGALSGAGDMVIGDTTVYLDGSTAGYSGDIRFSGSGGTLEINGNYSGATGTLVVASGTSLTGNGTWGGDVLVENGGSLDGTNLTVSGTVTVNSSYAEAAVTGTPPVGWTFYWNAPLGWAIGTSGNLATGAISDRSSWTPLIWNTAYFMWTADGDAVANNSPSNYLKATSSGGHPGAAGTSTDLDRYVISAYSVGKAGDYEIQLGELETDNNGNGVRVKIFLNGVINDDFIVPNAHVAQFSYSLEGLALNDEIAIAVGAEGHDGYDTYTLDYRIDLKP